MTESHDMRRAADLRPGDVIHIDAYPADLTEVWADPCGLVHLVWGVCQADQMAVSEDTAFAVVGRMPC